MSCCGPGTAVYGVALAAGATSPWVSPWVLHCSPGTHGQQSEVYPAWQQAVVELSGAWPFPAQHPLWLGGWDPPAVWERWLADSRAV